MTNDTNTTEVNIFELASRRRLRFNTTKGQLPVDELWSIPLATKGGVFDLDAISRTALADIREVKQESLVVPTPRETEEQFDAALRVSILKHVIAWRQAQDRRRAEASERKAKRARLEALLNEKDEEAQKAMSREDIAAQLAELDKADVE